MTTTPVMATVSRTARMASTAAWSAAFLSPRPIQRPHPSAAASVTRTSSRARLRSGMFPLPAAIAGTILLLGSCRRSLRGDPVHPFVEDDERAAEKHGEPADDDLPADRLAEDRPRQERGRDGLQIGEESGCLRGHLAEKTHVEDAQDRGEERPQDEDRRPFGGGRQ